MDFDDAIENLQAGGSFDDFARSTTSTWKSIAGYLMRRWECPAAVTIEDVTQELLLNAWIWYKRFDPNRGTPLRRFLIFNATQYAKRWVHVQRNATRRRDQAKSKIEIPFSTLHDWNVDYPGDATEALVNFMITIDLKTRRMRKLKYTLGKIFDSGFDKKVAIDSLVVDGHTKNNAKKMVEAAILEMRKAW